MQAGTPLEHAAEPALASAKLKGCLELEWLRLVPLEAAREYLMSIRGELLAPFLLVIWTVTPFTLCSSGQGLVQQVNFGPSVCAGVISCAVPCLMYCCNVEDQQHAIWGM